MLPAPWGRSGPVSPGLRVGIDLGGTKCLGVALTGDEIVAEVRRPSQVGGALVDGLADVVAELERDAATAGVPHPRVATVGVGAPGLVDRSGVVRVAPNLPGAAGLPLQSELQSRLGVPVDVENDATSAAWGEHRLGAARGRDQVVMVTLGTGIGGGVIVGGRICRGANGFAAELGHAVVDPNGPPCSCGRRGCWETLASGSGLGRLAREAVQEGRGAGMLALAEDDPEAVRGEHVTRALAAGDADAAEVFRRFCWWVALGLANLADIFDPEAFVIGGGLIHVGETLLGPVRRVFGGMLLGGEERPTIEILPAALGEHAGAIGAAYLWEGG